MHVLSVWWSGHTCALPHTPSPALHCCQAIQHFFPIDLLLLLMTCCCCCGDDLLLLMVMTC